MLSEPKIGIWLSLGNPIITEMASMANVDWMLYDLEHGFGMESDILNNLLASRKSEKGFFARVGGLNKASISRLMDWGVDGIMVPHVESKEMALECVKSINYPPRGIKGYSSSSRMYNYGKTQNEGHHLPLMIAQIESLKGIKNSRDIASVEGLDVLFIGPSDLEMDIKGHGLPLEETLRNSISTVLEAAKTCSKKAGILAKTEDDVVKYAALGFEFISFGSDLKFIREGLGKYDKLMK